MTLSSEKGIVLCCVPVAVAEWQSDSDSDTDSDNVLLQVHCHVLLPTSLCDEVLFTI